MNARLCSLWTATYPVRRRHHEPQPDITPFTPKHQDTRYVHDAFAKAGLSKLPTPTLAFVSSSWGRRGLRPTTCRSISAKNRDLAPAPKVHNCRPGTESVEAMHITCSLHPLIASTGDRASGVPHLGGRGSENPVAVVVDRREIAALPLSRLRPVTFKQTP
jgi:hypothetical protein